MKDITIIVTYAELTALIAVNGLFQGVNYLITDRGDRGLLFKASSTSKLESQGTRYMLCPATYAIGADAYGNNWIGVWNSTKTAVLDDLTIWNGQVWKCILAVTEPLTAPDLNAVNWVLIPKATFTNFEYIEMKFRIEYSVEDDWISQQSDNSNNIMGMGKFFFLWWYSPAGEYVNLIDYCDWNFATSGNPLENNRCNFIYNNSNGGGIYNNTVLEIYNNSNTWDIYSNTNDGRIYNNSNAGYIYSNSNKGDISDNSNIGDINSNSNNGVIYENRNIGKISFNNNSDAIKVNSNILGTTCDIIRNQNNGLITGVWDADVTDVIVDKTGAAV